MKRGRSRNGQRQGKGKRKGDGARSARSRAEAVMRSVECGCEAVFHLPLLPGEDWRGRRGTAVSKSQQLLAGVVPRGRVSFAQRQINCLSDFSITRLGPESLGHARCNHRRPDRHFRATSL
jgi:hypothetical protein